jgi:hypothetical protein
VPAPNSGYSIVEPRFHQDVAVEPKSEQENDAKAFSNILGKIHEDRQMLDKPANDTVETADPVQELDPEEEPAAPESRVTR